MYKSRHSGWRQKHKRMRAIGESRGFNTFVQINITVRLGNLWLSNIAATLFHKMLPKLCSLGPLKNFKIVIPGRVTHETNSINTSVLAPQHYHHMLVQELVEAGLCQRSVWWYESLNAAFPGSAVNQGPSSLLEQQARVQKKKRRKKDSTGQMKQTEKKKREHSKMSDHESCASTHKHFYLHRSFLSLKYKNIYLIFLSMNSFEEE